MLGLTSAGFGTIPVGAQGTQTDGSAETPAEAATDAPTDGVGRCAKIYDKARRLACLDAVARGDEPPAAATFVDRHWTRA